MKRKGQCPAIPGSVGARIVIEAVQPVLGPAVARRKPLLSGWRRVVARARDVHVLGLTGERLLPGFAGLPDAGSGLMIDLSDGAVGRGVGAGAGGELVMGLE
jgi:hypothetical protein